VASVFVDEAAGRSEKLIRHVPRLAERVQAQDASGQRVASAHHTHIHWAA
jgi:hypothetical protein